MAWVLDEDAAERFNPSAAGWEVFHGLYGEVFPEVLHRGIPRHRDFWVRGNERLVIEWDSLWRTVRAVIRDGKVNEEPMTAEEFDAVWA